ncbi:MAG: alpha-L-fucosidase [Cytophagales bacterium]|nr:alpha-L-fucosidase [Cytophagales bacterium]
MSRSKVGKYPEGLASIFGPDLSGLTQIALPQATEILETYQPDILWWDTPDQMTEERIQPFLKLVGNYPRLITNNRLAHSKKYGDFSTPEQHISATGSDKNFEVCMTLNDTWGYKTNDTNWKSSLIYLHVFDWPI